MANASSPESLAKCNTLLAQMDFYNPDPSDRPSTHAPRDDGLITVCNKNEDTAALIFAYTGFSKPIVSPITAAELTNESTHAVAAHIAMVRVVCEKEGNSFALLHVYTNAAEEPVAAVAFFGLNKGDHIDPTFQALTIGEHPQMVYSGPDYNEAVRLAREYFQKNA